MKRFLTGLLGCCMLAAAQQPDLILHNGRIVTLDDTVPEASALAVAGDRIVAVGPDSIAKLAGPKTRIIDLQGRLAMPGFIEGHGHFMGLGEFRLSLNLREARTWDDIVEQVARAAKQAKPGEWIIGRGWHQSKWNKAPTPNTDGFPLHTELSKVSPNNPVLLTHASGHASFVNAAAMKAAGITAQTPDPAGGHIMKDSTGQPTGLLQERAAGLASKAMDEWRARRSKEERLAEVRRIVDLASEECLAKGITSFQDAGSPFEVIDLIKSLADAGSLKLRLWMMLRVPNAELAKKAAQYKIIGAGNNTLTVRAVKRAIDGALGPRGAWLLEPYSDLPTGAPNPTGLNTDDPADIRRTAEICAANGLQLCVHAIGDRANREALNIFEPFVKNKNLRWRIEHAQHLSAPDIPRFGKLGVIAAMQGIHCTSDAPYVLARLGAKRAEEGAYVWQKLMKSGAVVGNGTDAPVEDVSPLASYYATVSRKLKDGARFYPDQRMSRVEALRSYTINNAYAAFEDDIKGTLAPGKLADITVLSRDILTIPEEEIPLTDVVYTIVGGQVAFAHSTPPPAAAPPAAAAAKAEWPQILGPSRNGISAESPSAIRTPQPLWKKPIGAGFSGPAVANGRLILFHRLNDKETVESLDPKTGNRQWIFEYPTTYRDDFGFDEGPRAIPTISGNRVYTFGAEGVLHAIDLNTGRKIWRVDTATKFGVRKGFFGAAAAPLVQGGLVFLNVGGPSGAGVVAFDAETGNVKWQLTNDDAGYSSPVYEANLDGAPAVVFFTRQGLEAVDPTTGKLRFQYPWRSRTNASVNAALPIVSGNRILLTSSYNTGAVLLDIKNNTPTRIWSGDESLSAHYATPVLKDGYLYGFHGRQEFGQSFRCVELATGKVMWDQEGFGAGSLILAGNKLLILRESGELVWANASPKEFRPEGKAALLPAVVRAFPALANGVIYARNEHTLGAWQLF